MFKRSPERKNPRLQEYDYSQNGYYFITICTEDMEHRFGRVENGIMNLNECGVIIRKYWYNIPNVFSNCMLDEMIIMPNHFHCVIQIDNDNSYSKTTNVGVAYQSTPLLKNVQRENYGVDRWATPTVHGCAINVQKRHGIPIIMRWFKSNITKQINQINPKRKFKWQRLYIDRVIRDEKELYRIRQYIRNNPSNW